MPIRMRRDENQSEGAPNRNRGNTGGGGGNFSGGGILSFLLPLLFKNPKLIIVALVLFGGWYLFKNGCNSAVVAPEQQNESALYKGCEMKPEELIISFEGDLVVKEIQGLHAFS